MPQTPAAPLPSTTGHKYWMNIQYSMDHSEWIAACAHQLQRRWRTVNPEVLEDVAADLWADESLRMLPATRATTAWLEPVSPPPANGMLARVPGNYIARGSQELPAPSKGQPEKLQTVIDVANLGRVRITYRLMDARHRGKGGHCFWTACHAETID